MNFFKKRSFKASVVLHVVFVLALIISSANWSGCFKKREPDLIPIEFLVAIPPEMQAEASPEPTPEPEVISEPEPEPDPVVPEPKLEPAKPKPKPKPEKKTPPPKKKKKIKIGKRVTRNSNSAPEKTLSEDEIEKLLNAGAKPSNHTSIPGENARCLARVQQVLLSAWVQPSGVSGGRTPELRIRLNHRGEVVDYSLIKKSGNAAYDASVLQAAGSLKVITGLTPGFLKRYKEISIEFKLEGL